MELIICIIGAILFIEGLPYAAFPGAVREVMAKVCQMPDRNLRWIGFSMMALGLFLLYMIRG